MIVSPTTLSLGGRPDPGILHIQDNENTVYNEYLFYYKVFAYNAVDESIASNVVSVTTVGAAVDSAVGGSGGGFDPIQKTANQLTINNTFTADGTSVLSVSDAANTTTGIPKTGAP